MPDVSIAVADGVATLALGNPRHRNAITQEMAEQLLAHCARVERDGSIGVVVIRAEGEYFCSGADTRDLASASRNPASTEAVTAISNVYRVFERIERLPVPTVSVVVGGAVGAGMNLAMATDTMLTTPDAVFDSGFLARRIHPGGGHINLLGRSLGRPTAAAMALFGHPLTGARVHELGWALACVPVEELGGVVEELVAKAGADPALARRIKSSTRLELGPPAASWDQALEIERGAQMWSMGRKGEAAWGGGARGE